MFYVNILFHQTFWCKNRMPVSSFSESQHLASFVYKINHSSLDDFSLSNYRGCGYEKKVKGCPKAKQESKGSISMLCVDQQLQ